VSNNRQHERLPIVLPVVLVHEGREIPAESRNLSAGGMNVFGGTEIPFGAAVRVRATLPGGQELDVPATVRWIRDGAIGVQFGSLRAKETWAIHQLVKQSEPHKP